MKKRVSYQIFVTLLLACLGGAILVGAQKNSAAEMQLQAAIHKETIEGDLDQAIRMYKDIVSKYSANRSVAASALMHMGQAYEKLGSAEARKTYERIALEFADQKGIAADAGRRLEVLSGQPTDKPATARVLANDSVTSFTSINLDGRWMATTDGGDVAIRDLSTGQVARLKAKTESQRFGGAERAALSPDLQKVAYTWWTGELGHGYQLRVMSNEAGSKPRILSDNSEFDFYFVTWLPDGKSVLASALKPDKTWQLVRVSMADGSIKVLKSLEWRGGGQGVPGQPHGPFPSISPDGRFLAYSALAVNPRTFPPASADPKDLHIYILPTDGSGHEIELVKNANSKFPVWAPDGSRVVYASDTSGKWDLWSVPVSDGKAADSPFLEKRDIGEIQPIGMTRSGSLYYIRTLAPVPQFSIAEIAPGGGSRIVETIVGEVPTWSPDGNSIAFLRRSDRAGNSDVVVRAVESGTEKVYASSPMRTSPPTWFHDGRGLLQQVPDLANPQAGVTSVFFVDTKSGQFKQILPPMPDLRVSEVLALSPDDKTLYFFAGDIKTNYGIPKDRIIAVDLSNGQSRTVLRLPGTGETLWSVSGIALSPDGGLLALTGIDSKRTGSQLVLVRVDGSDYHEIYGPFRATPTSNDLAWTKDGRAILFPAFADDGTPQIMRVGIDGGTPQSIGLAVKKGLGDFAVSPDGAHIAVSDALRSFSAGSPTTELLAIDNLPSLRKDVR